MKPRILGMQSGMSDVTGKDGDAVMINSVMIRNMMSVGMYSEAKPLVASALQGLRPAQLVVAAELYAKGPTQPGGIVEEGRSQNNVLMRSFQVLCFFMFYDGLFGLCFFLFYDISQI